MDLYSEIILDHFKHPHNKEKLENPSIEVVEHNPTCGDKITLQLEIDKNDKIKTVGWYGEGCAISQASMSMLSDELIGKTTKEIKKLENQFIYDMLMIPISAGRIKCALLSLIASKKAILTNQYKND